MTVRAERTGALGRGLAALIPQRATGNGPVEIPLARIRSNPYQPRRRVDQTALAELAASIAEHGVLQPILVTEQLDGYQLVAGERRVRAAEMAGLERIPAVIRQLADRDQLELAIVENVQRADLTAVEEAHAYRQLIDDFGFSQEQIATRVGRARPTIANTLRLLDLPDEIQEAVGDGRISEGHGRALLGLPGSQQRQVVEVIESRDLSVRQTEELARRLRERPNADPATTASAKATHADPDLERVEEHLREALGTKVSLARSRRGGRIVIEYYSDEELNRLYERLTGTGGTL
jgi:ParB family chromosome partitioning protein